MNRNVYLDNAATTKIKKEVLDAMMPYLTDLYGNPSANYSFAKDVRKRIEHARKQVAELINCAPGEVYFTSGGTESDNWAIKIIAEKCAKSGRHIITTKIEHHAVLNAVQWLEKKEFEITYLGVDSKGLIDLDELEKSIRPDTVLISIMAANNEIGTIQPIDKIGKIARSHNIFFHTDAVQAFGHIPIDVKKMKIDLLSASGHKIHGPKGIGILYVKSGVDIEPFIHGGAQENGRRGGTYNVPGIIGMGQAAEIAKIALNNDQTVKMRDYFIGRILDEIPNSLLNGDPKRRLPNNINVRFDGVDTESLLVMLDQYGIYASVGSACTTGQVEPSHVLTAIGLTSEQAHNSLRLSISDETSKSDADYVTHILKEVVCRLRG